MQDGADGSDSVGLFWKGSVEEAGGGRWEMGSCSRIDQERMIDGLDSDSVTLSFKRAELVLGARVLVICVYVFYR